MTALFAAATAVWGSSNHRTFHEATFMEMPPCTRRSASLACSTVSPSQSCPHVRPVGRLPPRVAAQRAPGERHPPVPPRSRMALRSAWRAAFQAPVRPSGNGLSGGGRPRASQSDVIPRPATPSGAEPAASARAPPPHPHPPSRRRGPRGRGGGGGGGVTAARGPRGRRRALLEPSAAPAVLRCLVRGGRLLRVSLVAVLADPPAAFCGGRAPSSPYLLRPGHCLLLRCPRGRLRASAGTRSPPRGGCRQWPCSQPPAVLPVRRAAPGRSQAFLSVPHPGRVLAHTAAGRSLRGYPCPPLFWPPALAGRAPPGVFFRRRPRRGRRRPAAGQPRAPLFPERV